MLSVAEIIKLSWETYISKIKKYLPLATLVFLFSAMVSAAGLLLENFLPSFAGQILTAAVSLIFYALSFGVTVAIILRTDQILNNKNARAGLKEVAAVFWPALLISVLVGIITAGGFLLLIVPGILFSVWFAFGLYIAVLEKKRNTGEILKQSRELSRGRFGQIFWRTVLPGIFWTIIAYLVLMGLYNLLGIIFNQSLIAQEELSAPLGLLTLLVSDLVAAFFSVLPLISMTIVYKETKK